MTLTAKGELTDEAAAVYERARRSHQRLLHGASMLAESLALPLPELLGPATEEPKVMHVSVHDVSESQDDANGLYADTEACSFYEQLPDLKSVLPAVLFGDACAVEDEDSRANFSALLSTLPQVLFLAHCTRTHQLT